MQPRHPLTSRSNRLSIHGQLQVCLCLAALLAACASAPTPIVLTLAPWTPRPLPPNLMPTPTATLPATVLRLSAATGAQDSGLLDAILPLFERQYGARVQVTTAGTGTVLSAGAQGQADAILVHAPTQEEVFVTAGKGINRQPVAYSDYVIVGPDADPARIRGMTTGAMAFAAIADAKATFITRTGQTGTYIAELNLWTLAGLLPDPQRDSWYRLPSSEQTSALQAASDAGAYTLTTRPAWLRNQANLPNLRLLVGGTTVGETGDPNLVDYYSAIQINPAIQPSVNAALAAKFIEWITSVETQQAIYDFGIREYGQPIFIPDSAAWHAAHP